MGIEPEHPLGGVQREDMLPLAFFVKHRVGLCIDTLDKLSEMYGLLFFLERIWITFDLQCPTGCVKHEIPPEVLLQLYQLDPCL